MHGFGEAGIGLGAAFARGFDVHGRPWRAQGIGEAAAGAHHVAGGIMAAHGHQHAIGRGPGAGQRLGAHGIEHLRIDRLGCAAQYEFAQRRQIGAGEEVMQRARRLVRDIDLARAQPLDQLIGRSIDHLDLGTVEQAIGHCLAHPHMGERSDDIVEAFKVLDVERGPHVDPGGEDFLHVLPALVMPAARRVGMGEFVDQHERGLALENRVEVHFQQGMAAMRHFPAGQHRQRAQTRLGFDATMGFDHADHDIDPGTCLAESIVEHFAGLANARSRPKENLEAA